MGIDPRGLAQAMGDAEARLAAVKAGYEARIRELESLSALQDSEIVKRDARIHELEAALRDILEDKCADTIDAARKCLTAEMPSYRSAREMPDGGYVYAQSQEAADAKVTAAETGAKDE